MPERKHFLSLSCTEIFKIPQKKALKKLLLGAVTFGVIEAISELGAAGQGIRGTRYERKDNIYLRQLRVMSFSLLTHC